jgi:hypothetical protein
MLHHQEALVAGIRVEDQYDEAGNLTGRYLGSLVSDPHYSGGKIGEALFEKIIENEGKAVVLALHCDPSNAISQKYIEMGFVAKSVELYPGDVPILYTEKSPSRHFQSQHWSKEEVIRASIMNHSPEIQIITTPQGTPPDFSLLNQGFVLTRYFTQGGNCYAVFEQEPLQSATITGSSG